MENEKIQQLEQRIKQLEEDVRLLKLNQTSSSDQNVVSVKSTKPLPVDKPIEKSTSPLEPPRPTTEPEPKEPTDWEHIIGRVWLPRIFIFVLLIGVLWGLVVAVDAGILNETARVLLGFVTAVVLYILGDKQIRKDRAALGKSLLVGSIAVAILTTLAMHFLYYMIPSVVNLFLNVIWIGVGIYLSARHRSQAMGIMFAVVGYLVPFLTRGTSIENAPFIMVGYELIFYIALLLFAVKMQYRTLLYVSTIFLHVAFLLLVLITGFNLNTYQMYDAVLMWIAVGILIQHQLLFGVIWLKKMEHVKGFPLLFTSFLLTLMWLSIGMQGQMVYLFILGVLTIQYGVFAYQAYQTKRNDMLSVSTVLATIVLAVFIMEVLDNEAIRLSIYLLQGFFAVYIGYRFNVFYQKIVGTAIYFLAAFVVVITPVNTFLMGWSWNVFNTFLLVVTLYMLYLMMMKFKVKEAAQVTVGVLLLAHISLLVKIPSINQVLSLNTLLWIVVICSLFFLYQLVKKELHAYFNRVIIGVQIMVHLAFITLLMTAITANQSVSIELMSLSIGWILYAVGIILAGFKYQKKSIRLLGIALLMLSLMKLVIFDLFFISIMFRAILFIGIGVVGIALSRLFYTNK
ncbi:DUF2339 domain-containing protein [Bacillus sp. FJAT-45037]|uniref:DUF2339 domain-containing protein n=1 Tax=Bacillus sp. FJAT-45037 TaxID=2011007 RepID=UPI000C24BA56|nr:DUF2339 domain-containing protein [Bacillus sp. FJAT-45037]